MAQRLRLADLLGGLSIVADMGFGLPLQAAMRTSVVSATLADRLGLDEAERRDSFYVPLLMHVGCISMAHDAAVAFVDEHVMARAVSLTNVGDPDDVARTLMPELTRGLSSSQRARVSEYAVAHGVEFARRFDTSSCEVARATAARLGLPQSTQRALHEVAEAWQGGSAPQGLRGDDIALAARVARVAADAVFFDDVGGVDRAVLAVRLRAGGVLDPDIADAFISAAADVLAEVGPDAGDPRDRILDVEPAPVLEREPADMIAVAAAFGDLADLKSRFFHGHSAEVARMAVAAGRLVGLDPVALHRLEVAGLLHDVGRVGISNRVWEKPGPLTRAEWEQVRMHGYHSERVLATSASLEPMAVVAGMHHERLDGSGYHRGCRASEIGVEARLLGAADAYVALCHARPHREALSREAAAKELRAQARSRRLDSDAVAAVLAVAGQGAARRVADLRPAGLTNREVEVLRLMAAGHSNAVIGERLFISRRTAEHHVQHVYTKIGASTRAAAALFAVQYDLLSAPDLSPK